MSNRNLAGAKQVAPIQVDAAGQAFTAVAPATAVVPDTMDQLPALPPGDYTLYEVAGLRGLSWWTIPLNVDGTRNCSLWNYVWSQAGNLIFTVSKTALQVTIAIKEAAAADDPLKFLYDESGGAVSTVFAVFFVPVASLMFILAGIWAGINALRRKGHPSGPRRGRGRRGHHRAGRVRLHRDRRRHQRVPVHRRNGRHRDLPGQRRRHQRPVRRARQGQRGLHPARRPGQRDPRATAHLLRAGRRPGLPAVGDRPVRRRRRRARSRCPGDWTVVTPGADGAIPIEALREEKALPCYVDRGGGLPGPADLPHRPARRGADR